MKGAASILRQSQYCRPNNTRSDIVLSRRAGFEFTCRFIYPSWQEPVETSGSSMTPGVIFDEAITAIETTKETWYEAEAHRIAGEIALMSVEPDATKAQACFESALACPRSKGEVLGAARVHVHGAAAARSRKAE